MSKHFDKALVSVMAFLGEDMGKLISLCGLEPLEHWRIWTDNRGNELHIEEDKSIKIKKSKVIDFKTYDIYYKASPTKIVETSKWALFAQCDEEDCMFIWLISSDNKMRLLSFVDGEYKNKSPLTSGINTLMYIIKNMSSESVEQVSEDIIEPPVKRTIIQAFSTPLPPPDDPDNMLKNTIQEVISQFESVNDV